MGSSTELYGEIISHTQNSDLFAIFLIEKRHRTKLHRLINIHYFRYDLRIFSDLLIHQVFYLS